MSILSESKAPRADSMANNNFIPVGMTIIKIAHVSVPIPNGYS